MAENETEHKHTFKENITGLGQKIIGEIESLAVQGTVETGKLGLIKEKQRRIQRLLKAWACPAPPWREVPANLLWNIHNAPAAQISMMGKITGLTFAPVAACATFGVTLKLAMDAIHRGEAKAVVIGATDPPHKHTLLNETGWRPMPFT